MSNSFDPPPTLKDYPSDPCEDCAAKDAEIAALRDKLRLAEAEESALRRRALSAELDRDEALALLASERESYDGILRATRLALEMRVAERDTLVAKLKARREQAGDSTPPEVETP